VALLRGGAVSSGQSFSLRLEEDVLREVLRPEQWEPWLADRLSRRATSSDAAETLAREVAPFLEQGKGAALRIARFLGREMEAEDGPPAEAVR
jgi:hypothetical protein